MKIKKGDKVIILAGKERGKSGKIEKVLRRDGKVIILGLNVSKSHQKARRGGEKSQMVEKSMPIHISNVQILDPKTQKPTRIKKEMHDNKSKRVTKKSGSILD